MRKVCMLFLLQCCLHGVFAHEGGHHPQEDVQGSRWELKSSRVIHGSLITVSKEKAYFELTGGEIIGKDISDFGIKDQAKLHSFYLDISSANGLPRVAQYELRTLEVLSLIIILIGFFLLYKGIRNGFRKNSKMSMAILAVGLGLFLYACDDSEVIEEDNASGIEVPANDPDVLSLLFEKFDGVSTSSDDDWFYISSRGLPGHSMMAGITNWQQQVPIDHEYTGDNSWAIPLQPKLSDDPLSTTTNLLKGAIAIAANGIPIFNPLNNRGEDANAIGELDQWGGHCGRADDYHYHMPPTHLQEIVGEGNPIAYALDGFPVYGETTEELDEYLGILNEDGSYQYHTISEYPYFMAAVRGEVTLDPNTIAPENQVMPQAKSEGVRPALSPLPGAGITDFQSSGSDNYTLTYTVNDQTYRINYGWDSNGKYTYEFIAPDGSSTTEVYQRN